jgi:hypothetical protein
MQLRIPLMTLTYSLWPIDRERTGLISKFLTVAAEAKREKQILSRILNEKIFFFQKSDFLQVKNFNLKYRFFV